MKKSPFLIAGMVGGILMASVGVSAEPKNLETGEKLYNSTCVACHGKNGRGKLPGVPDLTKSDGRLSKDTDVLVAHIMDGFRSPGSPMAMPAKGGISSLTAEQAEAIVNFMREAFTGQ